MSSFEKSNLHIATAERHKGDYVLSVLVFKTIS